MGSKLRPLYDKLYIGVETWLLARAARHNTKSYAALLGDVPQLRGEYDGVIRPYWAQFRLPVPKKYWYTRLVAENRADPRYIPDDLWFSRIIPHYNNLIFAKALQDKCLLNLLFPDMRRPETVVKNIAGVFYDDSLNLLTREEAAARCHGRGRIIVKPSVSSGQGHNIRFYDSDSLSGGDIEDIFQLYGQNFIIQEKMSQHPDMARFNPGSLNTVRIITFLHRDQVHILSAILRIGGTKNEVDNISQGGFQCSIRPDGQLESTAMTKKGDRWIHVDTCAAGVPFAGAAIPGYDKVTQAVCRHAAMMSHFKIIGWDIGISPEGEPVLIEYNVIPDQNQGTSAPTFGPLTEEVLSEVFGKRR